MKLIPPLITGRNTILGPCDINQLFNELIDIVREQRREIDTLAARVQTLEKGQPGAF